MYVCVCKVGSYGGPWALRVSGAQRPIVELFDQQWNTEAWWITLRISVVQRLSPPVKNETSLFSCAEPFCVLQWYLELIKCYLHNGEWAWIIKLLVFDLFPFSVNSKTSNDSNENKIKLLLYFTCLHNKMVVLANIFSGNFRYWKSSSAQGNSEIDFSCFLCLLESELRHL